MHGPMGNLNEAICLKLPTLNGIDKYSCVEVFAHEIAYISVLLKVIHNTWSPPLREVIQRHLSGKNGEPHPEWQRVPFFFRSFIHSCKALTPL